MSNVSNTADRARARAATAATGTTPAPPGTDDLETQLQVLQDQFDGKNVTKAGEKLLHELGFGGPHADKHFTAQTAAEVKSFQKAAGLHPTGALDAHTIGAMRKAAQQKKHGIEAPGQKSHGIAKNERRLQRAGYEPGHADGVYDAHTAKAAARFKHDQGIRSHSRAARGLMGPSAQKSLKNAGAQTKHVESELKTLGGHPGRVDGKYTAQTQRAVDAFRRHHHLRGVGTHANQGTLRSIRKAYQQKTGAVANRKARQEMRSLERVAHNGAAGKRPLGRCLAAVQNYLDVVKYGKGKVPRLPYAHDFADYLNRDHNARKLGLKKLDIHNPYDAPPGAIVVVRAGTPGTAHPFAGDIVVRGHGSHLYNDGEMSYGGPGNFPRGNNYVLGVYVPAGYRSHHHH